MRSILSSPRIMKGGAKVGCDIHPVVEVRRGEKWEAVKPVPLYHDWTDDPDSQHVWEFNRNYDAFAVMANVRNGYGFGGCDTGDELVPISPPRGLPHDRAIQDEEVYGDHSYSWLLLSEILSYDWGKKRKKRGFMSKEAALEVMLNGKKPESWCGWTSDKTQVQAEWEVTYKETTGALWDFIEMVQKQLPKVPAHEIRIVFGFDS